MTPSIADLDAADQRTAAGSFITFATAPPLLFALAFPEPRRAPIPDARLRWLAREIHALGERPLYELLREIVAGREIEPRLEAYARLPAAFIKACGGDQFAPLRVVDGDANDGVVQDQQLEAHQ
jgi:hypothetical protein